LELWKWIIIPVMLILVMVFRPTGLIAFRDFDVRKLLEPKSTLASPHGGSRDPKSEGEV
jgi:hypothetical protein